MRLLLPLVALLALPAAPAEKQSDGGAAASAPPTSISFRPGRRYSRGALGRQSATVWAVLLGADGTGSGALVPLFHSATALHLAAQLGEVSCAEPTGSEFPASVPRGPNVQVLTVQFRTEGEARGFAAALETPPLWVGRVRIHCAD